MSVVIRFTVPAERFPLGEVLTSATAGQVRLETLVPTGEAVIPYVWVTTDDAEGVEAALADSSLIERVTRVDESADETLFRVVWSDPVDGIVDALGRSDGVLLEVAGTDDVWSFRARFDDHGDVSAFYQWCVDAGVPITLEELHGRPRDDDATTELTDAQREAFLAALDTGYYDVPRAITLQGLAERLGISDTALSQRLRRGTRTVLSSTFRTDGVTRSADDVNATDADDDG
jgi:predicted DNA binding protein